MDYALNLKWKELLLRLEKQFGSGLEIDGLLFLIGVQELGKGPMKFTKDQKIEVMHIAICTLLSTYGIYEYKGVDEDKWPHFERTKKLPNLSPQEQERLMKEAIIEYFSQEPSPS